MTRPRKLLALFAVCLALLVTVSLGFANGPGRFNDFTFARVVYKGGGGFFRGFGFGQWAMDFPSADANIIRVLRLMTTLRINEPQAIELNSPELMEIPFLYILEVCSL